MGQWADANSDLWCNGAREFMTMEPPSTANEVVDESSAIQFTAVSSWRRLW